MDKNGDNFFRYHLFLKDKDLGGYFYEYYSTNG